ncbi:phage tail tape measure protein [Staphylococcus epidermidis]|uniref:phage tail tape measure protein n=1 Tax=Staphylococcus epidermidis TaxID=1282 RepID=UPI00026C0901|nr:phage tail tape measure protein [Staphylococcus epidermidis]EJD80587.1 phage tail tape measure protein, TP901 family [Staphylococcus epidermidis NIHLM095]EJD83212.1 phage tail tape measure protein, TP901 family [Staphylococcus epidermidis NIHLM087]MCT1660389.1 phage tail tape measure protein [Staphylococcus epidermidis]MDH9341207.1 phage tail tape measure protein [Staphylococcus epidermidis]MDH9360387.1 phage tail tape measure protein [Staphylococcus epidermidis]
MDEKLQGLTLEMSLDAIGVQEGMKGLKRQLGVVNSEMKANLSAFDNSEKSMEKYEATLKGLNEKLKVQNQMFVQSKNDLSRLNADYQNAVSRVKDVERAYEKLVETNKKNKLAYDQSTNAMKESNAELKKSEAQFARTVKRKDEAWQKLKQLRQAEKDLKESNEATTAQLNRANNAIQKQVEKHKELVAKYKEEESQVKKLRQENRELLSSHEKITKNYQTSNKELKETGEEFKQLNTTIKNHNKLLASAERNVNNELSALNKLERQVNKTKSEMNDFNREQVIANSSFTKVAEHADKLSNKFGAISDKMKSTGKTMSVGITAPVITGFGAAIKTSADFEAQMSKVGAIAQASSSDLKAMTNEAVDLGAKTSKSASEVAKGMQELASLGFDAKQTMEAMPGVISASEASGAELATTAQVMASSINAFGLKASDATHVADLLATAANDSAADINYMGDALKYAGTPAKALGVTLEDTSAAIEVMSNSGLDGSQAGTALRASFIKLASPSKEASTLMQQLGVHLMDAKGHFVGMPQLIAQFQNGLKGMSKEQKLAAISTVVGSEAASGFLSLIDAGPSKIDKYSNALKNSDGASKKASDQMKNNLKGSVEQLKGAFESLGIKIGNDLAPAIKKGADWLSNFVDKFSSMPGFARKGVIALGLFAGAIGPIILAGGILAGVISKAVKGYRDLNKTMAINSAEAAINAKAIDLASDSIGKTGKVAKNSKGYMSELGDAVGNLSTGFGGLGKKVPGVGGKFGKFGSLLGGLISRFGSLGNVSKFAVGAIGKLTIPLTIITTVFTLAYQKLDWFKQGIHDLGRLWNETVGSLDFLWIGKFTKGIGTAWDKTKEFSAKLLELTPMFKMLKVSFDGIHKGVAKATDKIDVFGKGVSKETKSALGSFVNYSEKSSKILDKMRINHGDITQKEAEELTNLNKKMSDDLIEQMNKRKDNELKIAHDVLDKSTAISEEDKKRILKKTEEKNDIAINKTQELNRKIKEIEDKRNNGGKLTDKEVKDLESLYKQRQEIAVKALSNGEKEQQRILTRMSINRKAVSVEDASETVKEANKARDDAKKDAKKRYDDKIDEINSMVGLSQKEREKLLKEAKDKYDNEKQLADKNHDKVIKNLKGSNKDIEKEIDLSNGNVYTGFQKFWKNVKGGQFDFSKYIKGKWKDFTGYLGGKVDELKDLGKKIGKPFKDGYEIIKNKTKDIRENVKNWFGKTKESAEEKLTGLKTSAEKKWDKISSIAWSNAKSVWNGTSKWFGNAFSSLKGWVGDMYESAFDKFDSISSTAWSNAKSVYNGFKTWLSNTLDWIKEIGGEMADAAADLGKSVANKAIGGLNSMIGGINSISKAITDKDLIKPIPTLSTGTMASPSVSTDSNGGLTAPTLAIVNDRGVGNAPGGGVQEIIHRANGTLEAPQGRNVLVSLGVGDSVINANDTLRYQRMGVIPRFSTGTKKKDWLENMVSSIGKFGSKAKDTFHNIKTGAKDMIKAAGDKIKDGASWLSEKVGDVWDYIENPGKLVSKVMDSLDISFGEGNHATIKMAKGAFNILKTKLIDKVKSWFEEFGGGDGSYLFNYPIWQRFGSYTGGLGFNGGRHYGMDFGMPAGTKIYAVKGGTVDNVWYDYGGGNSIQIKTGPGEWNWYMHLSKQLVRLGEHIRTGQLIAESGATGAYCKGAHLHFQLMRGDHPGNDTAIDPESYLKSLKGAAGGNGADAARSAILKAQAILGGNYRSSYITEQMMRVAKRESNYTANAVNDWDINAQNGTPSKGMFQMIEPSFRTYAIRGHSNIMNPVDEAISAMRYIVATYGWNGFKRAGDYAYANGGLVTHHQIAEIGEGNKPEMIIPLTKRSRAIKLIEDAMRIVGMDTSSSNVTVNHDNSTVEKLLNHIAILTDTGNKLTRMLIETVKPNQQNNSLDNVEQTLSKISATRALALNYMEGGLDI